MIHRRALITGLISLVAAPAIVRISSIMPVLAMDDLVDVDVFPLHAPWDTATREQILADVARAMFIPVRFLDGSMLLGKPLTTEEANLFMRSRS